jgi:hypothetical protein
MKKYFIIVAVFLGIRFTGAPAHAGPFPGGLTLEDLLPEPEQSGGNRDHVVGEHLC